MQDNTKKEIFKKNIKSFSMSKLFLSKKVDQTLLTELEEVLIQADLGVAVALRLKEKLAKKAHKNTATIIA